MFIHRIPSRDNDNNDNTSGFQLIIFIYSVHLTLQFCTQPSRVWNCGIPYHWQIPLLTNPEYTESARSTLCCCKFHLPIHNSSHSSPSDASLRLPQNSTHDLSNYAELHSLLSDKFQTVAAVAVGLLVCQETLLIIQGNLFRDKTFPTFSFCLSNALQNNKTTAEESLEKRIETTLGNLQST